MKTFKPEYYPSMSGKERKRCRDAYVEFQHGRCYKCDAPLSQGSALVEYKVTPKLYPPGFFNNPVHLHHDHKTGYTIGAVHAHCNAVLWEYDGE